MKIKKILILLLSFCFLSACLFAGANLFSGLFKDYQRRLLYKARQASWKELEQKIGRQINRFKGEAAVVVKDMDTGLEFSYNRDKLFPSASLVKVPVMVVCFLAADKGRIGLSQEIELKSSDKLSGSGDLKDIPAGTTFSVERLIGLMIYDSDNTAANMLTGLLGLDYLNDSFRGFGLKNTALSRRIADYKMRDRGVENYTTASDMSMLMEKIYRRQLGSRDISEHCIRIMKLTHTNDRIPRYLPAEVTVAHKTGLENGVCHDAGIVFSRKGDFLVCVLTRHTNSNSLPSKKFIGRIALSVYRYFEQL